MKTKRTTMKFKSSLSLNRVQNLRANNHKRSRGRFIKKTVGLLCSKGQIKDKKMMKSTAKRASLVSQTKMIWSKKNWPNLRKNEKYNRVSRQRSTRSPPRTNNKKRRIKK